MCLVVNQVTCALCLVIVFEYLWQGLLHYYYYSRFLQYVQCIQNTCSVYWRLGLPGAPVHRPVSIFQLFPQFFLHETVLKPDVGLRNCVFK